MNMPGADSSVPFMEMKYEIVDLSTEPVDDSYFEIPAGYEAAAFADLMNGKIEERLEAAKKPNTEARNALPGDVQVYVPSMFPLHRTEAKLPEERGRRTFTAWWNCC